MEIRMRTGQVMTEGDFRAAHPNTSFPQILTEDLLAEFGADPVLNGPQPQPNKYQIAFRDGVQEINGKWFTKYSVVDLDADTIAYVDANQARLVREDRNQRLSACDWTQLADSPVDKALWLTYRQALREVPSQPGFPWEVTWPIMPDS